MYSIPPSDKSGARVEKGVILSDDEDVPQPASRRKNRSITSSRMSSDIDLEAEQNLKAMMDVDDGSIFPTNAYRIHRTDLTSCTKTR